MNTSALTVDQRRRLIDLLTLIRPWLEGKPASPTPAESRARPTAAPPVDRLSTPPSASTDRPIPSSVSSGSSKTTKEEPAAPLSMIGQIDAILQEKLAGSSLAGKNIRLKDSPGGGVTVFVGINRYAGLDEVPDEEIKAIIRASIAEWENKFTPGL